MLDSRFKDSPTKRIPSNLQGQSPAEDQQDQPVGQNMDTRPTPVAGRRESSAQPAHRPSIYDDYNQTHRRPQPGRPPARNRGTDPDSYDDERSKSKNILTGIYIAILVIAVAACLIIAVSAINWLRDMEFSFGGGGNGGGNLNLNGNTSGSGTEPGGRPVVDSFVGMITAISTDPRELTLQDTSSTLRNVRTLTLPGDAAITTRQGSDMTFAQLRVGQIVEISYNSNTSAITTVRESVHAREFVSRDNILVNLENQTISIGHDVFFFNSQTLVMHNGAPITIGQISVHDSITVVALGQYAWNINLDASHGFLDITNSEQIVNGRITVGGMHPIPFSEIAEPLILSEGAHHITIQGNNIATFSQNIVISQAQTLPLNLGNVELLMATLSIVTTPEDTRVFINGERVTMPSPVTIPFGEHTILVEHDDYYSYQRLISVVDPISYAVFELEAVQRTGTMRIYTIPSNAEIFVNGIPVGRSVLTQVFEAGTHTIMARMPGFADYTAHITIAPGDDLTRTLLLSPSLPPDGQPTTTSPLWLLPPTTTSPPSLLPPTTTMPMPMP